MPGSPNTAFLSFLVFKVFPVKSCIWMRSLGMLWAWIYRISISFIFLRPLPKPDFSANIQVVVVILAMFVWPSCTGSSNSERHRKEGTLCWRGLRSRIFNSCYCTLHRKLTCQDSARSPWQKMHQKNAKAWGHVSLTAQDFHVPMIQRLPGHPHKHQTKLSKNMSSPCRQWADWALKLSPQGADPISWLGWSDSELPVAVDQAKNLHNA